MDEARAARDVRFATGAFVLVALLFAAAGSIVAASDGVWLDEFWSFHLGDPAIAFSERIDRWLVDPHPMPINSLYLLVIASGADSPWAARLAINLPALIGLVAGTLLFASRATRSRIFYPVTAALLLGQLGAIGHFADFRSYFAQLAAIGLAVQYLHFLIEEEEPGRAPRFSGTDALGLAAIALSLSMHFVTPFLLSPVYALTLGWLARRGRRAAARRLGATLTVTWLMLGILAYLQLRRMSGEMDVSWLGTSTGDALKIYAVAGARTLASNPFLAAAAALAVFQTGMPALRKPFPIVLLAGAVAAGLGLLGINAVKPVILGRYVVGLPIVALAAMAAIAAHSLANRIWILAAVFAAVVVTTLLQSSRAAAPNWESGLKEVSRLADQCPATRIYGAGPWRFTPERASATALRETRVLAEGLRYLAGTRGLPLEMLDDVTPTVLPAGSRCPTLLWVEHFHPESGARAKDLLRRGRLSVPPNSEVRLFRTATGALFVIRSPPAPDGKLPHRAPNGP